MHRESMKLMQYFVRNYMLHRRSILTVLDVGARNVHIHRVGTYKGLFRRSIYTGMDVVEGPNVDIVGYDKIDKVYDVIISGQVMEHISCPWEWLRFLSNHYRKYICIIAPHTWEEHRYPIDTYRYMPDGMRDLFQFAGIKILEIVKGRRDTMGIGGK